MIAAYSSAVSGLNAASARLAERAGRIVQTPPSATDEADATTASSGGDPAFATTGARDQRDTMLVNDLVGLGYDKTAFKANLAVLRSAREMEERLLDIIT